MRLAKRVARGRGAAPALRSIFIQVPQRESDRSGHER
jgi:hypothetical protein